MNDFSKQLSKVMKSRGISQTELCEITGIPKSAMSQYISGAFKPKQERTYLLAQALETTPEYLMGLTDDTEPQVSFEIADIVFNSCKAAGITAEQVLKRQLSGQETELLVAFGKLNPIGRQKAIERVEELYEIERYRRENAT